MVEADRGPARAKRRGWIIPTVLALVVLTTGVLARGDLTIRRSVIGSSFEGIGATTTPDEQVVDARLRCSGLWQPDHVAQYVSESGDPLFFNESTLQYPDPGPLCDAAREDRSRGLLAIVLLGLLVAGGLAVRRRIHNRRSTEEPRRPTELVDS
jgi:hypothetical protein